VRDTVQLMVDVAGLCSWAPALETMRPAGMAPFFSAQRKRAKLVSRFSGVASTSASARAIRACVSSSGFARGGLGLLGSSLFLKLNRFH